MTSPARAAVPPASQRDDRWAVAVVVLVFGFALGQGMLVLPLLALAAGYDAATVGMLTAVSAVSQVAMRLTLPRMLARHPDRAMMAAACASLAASYIVLGVSQALPVFLVAQLLQGTARAFFWTSSQTHAARSSRGATRGIAQSTVWGNIGTMSGPAVAGVLATYALMAPVAVGAAAALVALAASRWLRVLPTYARRTTHGAPGMWRRPGVDLSCWSNVSTGGWRALLNSFVPVILEGAGHPPSLIGLILALGDAMVTITAATLTRRPIAHIPRAIGWAVALTAVGIVVFPFVASSAVAAALAIAGSGLAAGIQITLGPALASQSVAPHDQGEAIAVAGTFRAASLFATPGTLSLLVGFIAVPVAVALAGVAIAVPTGIVLARGGAALRAAGREPVTPP